MSVRRNGPRPRARRRPARGVLLALLATVTATLGAGAPAALADGSIEFFDNFDGTSALSFVAGDGDVNDIIATGGAGEVVIADVKPIDVAFSDFMCVGGGTNIVRCMGPPILLTIDAGDADDRVELSGPFEREATAIGGIDDDELIGGAGLDVLIGGNRGSLNVGDGEDTLRGNGGDDFLDGGTGDDIGDDIDGGSGSDSFTLNPDDGPDVLQGGAGIDNLRAFSGFVQPGYSYTLQDGLANDGLAPQNANILAIEDIVTGEGEDLVRGTAGANVISTLDADDDVDGLTGADLISLGSQDDFVQARDGYRDRIQCGSGTDIALVDQLDVHSGCENVASEFVTPVGTPAAIVRPPAPAPPPPPGAPPPPAPGATEDTIAPRCVTSVPRTLANARRRLVVRQVCNEARSTLVTLSAALRGVVVAARVGEVTLAERSLSRRSGQIRVTLRIPARLRRGLRAGSRMTVRMRSTDAHGNESSVSRTVRLRRR